MKNHQPDQSLEDIVKQRFYELFSKDFPVSFYWLDQEGYLLGCNQQVLQDLHIASLDQFVGKHITEVASEEAWQNCLEVMRSKKTSIVEEEHTFSDQSKICYLSVKSPLFLNSEATEGVLGISINITARKQQERALEEAKVKAEAASQAKSEFLANMRHDFRTPFVGILGMAQLLERKESDPEKLEDLRSITQSAQALLDQLNDIFEFIQSEEGELAILDKPFKLSMVVKESLDSIRSAARNKGVVLKEHYDDRIPPSLIGDSVRTGRILANLLSNSVKFTQNGSISLEVKLLRAEDREAIIQFVVQDTGIGIPPEKQDMVFERFNRLTSSYAGRYGGKGLGLKIVKQFLEELDGEIHLESKEGQGSRFTVIIPYKVPLLNESTN